MWAKTVERNAATKVGKDDSSTKEGIDRLLDNQLSQGFMQIFFGDWTDMPKEITVVTASGRKKKMQVQGAEFRYLYNFEKLRRRRQWIICFRKAFEDNLDPPGPADVDALCLPCNFEAKCHTHRNRKSPGMCPFLCRDILMWYASWCKVFSHEQRPVYKDFRWGAVGV